MIRSTPYPAATLEERRLRISLKSILKGWITLILWLFVTTIVLFGGCFGTAWNTLQQRGISPAELQFELSLEQEANLVLASTESQVVMLVFCGFVSLRAAYVTATSVRSWPIVSLLHGLLAIYSFGLLFNFLMSGLPSNGSMPIVIAWEGLVTFVGCIVGGIWGSED